MHTQLRPRVWEDDWDSQQLPAQGLREVEHRLSQPVRGAARRAADRDVKSAVWQMPPRLRALPVRREAETPVRRLPHR